MKKMLALLLTLVLIVLSVVSASAEPNYGGLNEFIKSSRSDFVGKGGLSKTTKSLETFDAAKSGLSIASGATYDSSNKKQGSKSLKYTANGGYFNSFGDFSYKMHTMFSGKPGFNVNVTDLMAQAVGMWFYVDNVDNLVCDHDDVYKKFQQNCGTIYFRFGNSSSNYHQWNHTFYGSGWHYIEFALGSKENTDSGWRPNIIYNNMKFIELKFETQGTPVTVRVDEISLITYKTTAQSPRAPFNGRWISTFDYNQLDGPTVTEWMGAYFDTSNKTQGTSSLMVRGRNEHVDYREVLCGYDNMPLYLDEDILIFDLYISDINIIGQRVDFWFYDITETKTMNVDFGFLEFCTKSGYLANGWNHIEVPLKWLRTNVSGNVFPVSRIKLYWYGNANNQYYTVGYDNMYVAKESDIEKGQAYWDKVYASQASSSNNSSNKNSSVTNISSINDIANSSKKPTSSGSSSGKNDDTLSEASSIENLPASSVTTESNTQNPPSTADTDVAQGDTSQPDVGEDEGGSSATLFIIIGVVLLVLAAAAVAVVIYLKKKKKSIAIPEEN